MSYRLVKIVTLCTVALFPSFALAEDVPWLMTHSKYDALESDQKQIYDNAYFETIAFLMYGYLPANPDTMKQLNMWIDCVNDTKDSDSWSPNLDWVFAENVDKSAAFVFYNTVSPLVCRDYAGPASTELKALSIYSYTDWQKFSRAQKRIYVAGYLDTALSVQYRMEEHDVPNDLDSLSSVVRDVGLERILDYVLETKFDQEFPLPWSVSRGVGESRAEQEIQ